jgi:GNAT superfamily N-acetyltransferase
MQEVQTPDLLIRQVAPSDIQNLWALIEALGHEKDTGYFEQCLERQDKGELLVLMVTLKKSVGDVGYCILNWQPKYALFKKLGMPEVQDLNVLRKHRRQGIGRTVIRYCEDLARQKGYTDMGIGVGLDSSYGPAQRLYIKMGYIPDGSGVSYDRKQVEIGALRPLDDNFCLMMTRGLS